MELFPDDYILGYWFASNDKNDAWYCIIKRLPDGSWYGEYTFRYSKGTDPWDDKDGKSRTAFTGDSSATEGAIIEATNTVFEVIKLKYSAFNDYFLVKGDINKFTDIAKTKDYMHMKMVN